MFQVTDLSRTSPRRRWGAWIVLLALASVVLPRNQAQELGELPREEAPSLSSSASAVADGSEDPAPCVSSYAVSSGGSSTAGGGFELTATIGQVGAGTTRSSDFTITGGFVASVQDPVVFSDGFESGDLLAWSGSVGDK